MHDEIHNVKEALEALPTQVFQVVAKSSKAKGQQRAHFVFKPVHKINDTLEAQKAQCPGPVRTLVYKYPVSPIFTLFFFNNHN